MRRIVLVLAVLSGSAVSAMAVTNELAQSAAEKPDDVQLQTAIAEAMRTSPLTANSLIVVHVNQGEVTLEGAAMSPLARREATRWPKRPRCENHSQPPERRQYANR